MNRRDRDTGYINDEDGSGTINFKYFNNIERARETHNFSNVNKKGWSARCDDANKHVYALLHEYGHRVTYEGVIKF